MLGIRIRNRIWIRRIRMFLGLPDPDPLVGGMDPDLDPYFFLKMCGADWINACKTKFQHKILAKKLIFSTDNVPVGKLEEKKWKKYYFLHP